MTEVGFIGLGSMGQPIALNLLQAGFRVGTYIRDPHKLDTHLKNKLKCYASPIELAFNYPILFTMVASTADVEELLIGSNGMIHGAKPGTIMVDLSTTSPTITKKIAIMLANKQIEMLDAPISGSTKEAANRTLTIMVGGKAKVLTKTKPILTTFAKHIIHVGDHGAGQLAKACDQLIAAETLIAIDEALRLAKTMSINPNKLHRALKSTRVYSEILNSHVKRMIEKNYTAGFKASLHRKNMHVALEQAHLNNVDLPAAKYATQCLDRLVMKGHSELDSAAIHLLTEE